MPIQQIDAPAPACEAGTHRSTGQPGTNYQRMPLFGGRCGYGGRYRPAWQVTRLPAAVGCVGVIAVCVCGVMCVTCSSRHKTRLCPVGSADGQMALVIHATCRTGRGNGLVCQPQRGTVCAVAGQCAGQPHGGLGRVSGVHIGIHPQPGGLAVQGRDGVGVAAYAQRQRPVPPLKAVKTGGEVSWPG